MLRYKVMIISLIVICTATISVWLITYSKMVPVPLSLKHHVTAPDGSAALPLLLDRDGVPLNTTYTTQWNRSDQLPLHKIPLTLQQIFILSEDQSFYSHMGIDWIARIDALLQNIAAGRTVRGASTITEQVIRMIRPRPRTLWSRWLEGFEARELEKVNSKQDILEFYLNQVPYASNRRGVVQAARLYFYRGLDTLNAKEILALATLVRAPSAYDLYNSPGKIVDPLNRLAQRAIAADILKESEWNQIKDIPFDLKGSELCVEATHFIRHVYNDLRPLDLSGRIHITDKTQIMTTLNSTLQNRVQNILATTLKNLKSHKVANGAVLIAEHETGEIVAWVVASNSPLRAYREKRAFGNQTTTFKAEKSDSNTGDIDAIKALRQPGSAMKPFLYALALEKGWSAATLIDDSPLKEPVGVGIHTYHNYSGIHYGAVTLRNALGNSLNIPALKTIRFTGVDAYLKKLRELGITTLKRHPDFYGDGLALGNGEVSFHEMVQAYSVLANSGEFIPLSPFYDSELKKAIQSERLSSGSNPTYSAPLSRRDGITSSTPPFSKEVTSIIGNILSDPGARELEFGGSDLLNFPVQTAVKTGTSSDYRDAWAMGYNRRYTAGVWMGNLDGSPTVALTGSRGPAFVLRSIFAELTRMREKCGEADGNLPLYMSPKLVQKDISSSDTAEGHYITKTEWFVPGSKMKNENSSVKGVHAKSPAHEKIGEEERNRHYKELCCISEKGRSSSQPFGFLNPVNGLEVAMDPRIPDELEYMEFKVTGVPPGHRIKWMVNGEALNREWLKNSASFTEDIQLSEIINPNTLEMKDAINSKRNCSDSNLSASEDSKPRSLRFNDTIQWKVQRGYHRAYIELIDQSDTITASEQVSFMVK